MKLSYHSKLRIKERTNFNNKERRNLFRLALINGQSINQIKDERTKQIMKNIKGCQVKLYRGYLFLYSKNSHQLYTMYELPKEE